MTYYRLAEQDRQTARWIWKTTAVTTLQAMLQLLRIYGTLPQGALACSPLILKKTSVRYSVAKTTAWYLVLSPQHNFCMRGI